MEVPVEELCKKQPEQFAAYMNYCRNMKFTEDPDYKYIIGLFEDCMKKNDIDPKKPEFVWNENRLMVEKRKMREEMMAVINKKPGQT